MEDLESEIQTILNDPAQMAQIMQIAESLGLHQQSVVNENPSGSAKPPVENSKQTALLHALLPFLSPKKQRRLEQALKIGKLSKIAGSALIHSLETE